MKKIGVGIIGASSRGGWASLSHMPALRILAADYDLRAIATTRRETADLTKEVFGASAAYTTPHELAADPSVDLVVVSVNVPEHYRNVSAAIDAGKHVLSEWPLGRNLAEAEELAARARARGVRTFVALQARFSPTLRYVHDLVADGYLGEVYGTSLVASGEGWVPEVKRSHAFIHDVDQGTTVLSVSATHAFDGLMYLLGDFASVGVTLTTRKRSVRIIEDGTTLVPTSPDQVAVQATLASGALVSAFYRGGLSRGENLRWELNGSDGDLVNTGPYGNLQVAPLTLFGGRGSEPRVQLLPVPSSYHSLTLPEGPPANIGYLYAAIARDLRNGTNEVPDFEHAVKRHRLVDTMMASARTGHVHPVR